jgi:hypothetical protein
VVDEAHKMSAHYFGNEVKETKRYRLGKLAGSVARHFLLMTATPHSGKEDDFELFMALLDPDRFEGKARHGVHADPADLMRRLVKERLLKFDGRPLFPERRAYSPTYPLSDDEALLYKRVTEYVQEEMNRADRLKEEGKGRRGAVVGFALTTLQRRLASSPHAIHQSLVRRRKRLLDRVSEERTRKRGEVVAAEIGVRQVPEVFRDVDEDFDLDDLPEGELEDLEEVLVDEASAAHTIAELEHEIERLGELEELARLAATHPSVVLDAVSVIVKPEVAFRQFEADRQLPPETVVTGITGSVGPAAKTEVAGAGTGSAVDLPVRFYGRITLGAVRLLKDVGDIAEAVIAQLARALDADVSITVEIEADAPKGFADDVRRTVTENARTLKFDFHEFEES